ncbi:hypothetical protein LQL77_30830 [Rhodococcus cerastii]|nr:hypothetical protein [Rhodococcus cerastii]
MKADDATELKELENGNALLEKVLAEAALEKAARGNRPGKNTVPDRQAERCDYDPGNDGALAAVRLHNRRATAIDPTESASEEHPGRSGHGSAEVVAGLGQSECPEGISSGVGDVRAVGWVINKKKVQRLWREEGLRVKIRKIKKRAGTSTTPITEADAPKVV